MKRRSFVAALIGLLIGLFAPVRAALSRQRAADDTAALRFIRWKHEGVTGSGEKVAAEYYLAYGPRKMMSAFESRVTRRCPHWECVKDRVGNDYELWIVPRPAGVRRWESHQIDAMRQELFDVAEWDSRLLLQMDGYEKYYGPHSLMGSTFLREWRGEPRKKVAA